jgi:glycerol-3-phosphate dehydrogenase (NAD(P)+)
MGEGRRAAELLADRRTVAEGAYTAPVLKRAADTLGVDMPIVAAVCALLADEVSVDDAMEGLLSRPLRPEGV